MYLQSNSSDFISNISEKFKSYANDVLPSLVGDEICNSMKEEEQQQFFKYQEFLYQYMKHLNKIPEEKLKQRGLLVYHGLGCHSKGTKIMMADGSLKNVEDIVVGEQLMGDDSTPRNVLELRSGKDTMYRVKPIKGEEFIINSEHILCLKISPDGVSFKEDKRCKNQIKKYCATYIDNKTFKRISKWFETKEEGEYYLEEHYKNEENTIMEISVNNYLKLPKNIKSKLKIYRKEINFNKQEVSFDPYIIGLWLGDGTSNTSEITNQDATIIKYLKEYLKEYDCYLQHKDKYTYRINSLNEHRNEKGQFTNHNNFINTLKSLNLINNKHIPYIYKCNSRNIRLQVLAGLIDSDGSYSKGVFEISQSLDKETLVNDIIYLCRSLGFAAYKKIKKTSWVYKGVKKYSSAFRIIISGENIEDIPVKILRKIADKRKQKKNVLLSGFSITEENIDNYYGFLLDKNHRYLMGDFVVSHNSGKTTSGILVSEACRDYKLKHFGADYETRSVYQRKVIMMMPASLLFDPWIKELASKCFSNCTIRNKVSELLETMKDESQTKIKTAVVEMLRNFDYHLVFYNAHTMKGGWKDKLDLIPTRLTSGEKYTNKYSDRTNPFDDSVVIIDEFHNLVNMISNKLVDSGRVSQMYRQLVEAKNMKIVAMTGTPIVNRPSEIAIIANIIRGPISNRPEIQFGLDSELFDTTFFNEDMDELRNPNMLKRRLNGLVSYYRGINESVFAQKVEEEVKCIMNSSQEAGYLLAQRLEREKIQENLKKNTLETDLNNTFLSRIKASNVVYPQYMFEEKLLLSKALTKNGNSVNVHAVNSKTRLLDAKVTPEAEEKILKMLDVDSKPLNLNNNLADFSKKAYHIIKKAMESNGPVLIYSRFEGLYGIKFLVEALKQNGFADYDKTAKKDSAPNGKFMLWTGKHRNDKTKKVFNSMENKDGKLIKLFLMTSTGKEGISLMGIRQIHIMEPWWNNIVIRQIIGRGLRICSHSHIPTEDFIDFRNDSINKIYNTRLVNVFKYSSYIDLRYKLKLSKNLPKQDMMMLRNNIKKEMLDSSIDYMISKISLRKEIQEKLILKALKEVAIDCHINMSRNNENINCFVDEEYDDYFKSWNIRDNFLITDSETRYKVIKFKGNKYLMDANKNVYKDLGQDNILDKNLLNNKVVRVGIYKNGEIVFDEYYKQKELPNMNRLKKVQNKFKTILEEILEHDIQNKSVMDISTITQNTMVLYNTFPKMNLVLVNPGAEDEELKDRIQKVDELGVKDVTIVRDLSLDTLQKLPTADYINIDPQVNTTADLAHVCNILAPKSKYIIIDFSNVISNTNDNSFGYKYYTSITDRLSRDHYYNKKYNTLVVFNKEYKNDLTKSLDERYGTKALIGLLDDFAAKNITSENDLYKILNEDAEANFAGIEITELVEDTPKPIKARRRKIVKVPQKPVKKSTKKTTKKSTKKVKA